MGVMRMGLQELQFDMRGFKAGSVQECGKERRATMNTTGMNFGRAHRPCCLFS